MADDKQAGEVTAPAQASYVHAFEHLTTRERAFLQMLGDGADPGAATIPGLYATIGALRYELRAKLEAANERASLVPGMSAALDEARWERDRLGKLLYDIVAADNACPDELGSTNDLPEVAALAQTINVARRALIERVSPAGHSENEVAKLRGLIERIGEASDELQLAVCTGSVEVVGDYVTRERKIVIAARKEARKDAGPIVAIPRDLAEMLERVVEADTKLGEFLDTEPADDRNVDDERLEDLNDGRDDALRNLVTVHRRWKGEPEPEAEANCCEHGDHEAPAGQRFCSDACAQCEHYSKSDEGCDGICLRGEDQHV